MPRLDQPNGRRGTVLSACNQVLASYLPEWLQPEETSGPAPSKFVATPSLSGRWQGTLTNGGAKMWVRLNIESNDSATLEPDGKPAEKITGMRSNGVAFTGVSAGLIDSPDARRGGAKALKIKLIPYKGMLAGSILATDSKSVLLPTSSA